MPIYVYRCSACGHAKDVLQKLSDPVLSVCPACGQATFAKQVTAAGFQLKGSGWYVTDFRDGNKGGKPAEKAGDKAADTPADKPAAKPSEAAPASVPAVAPTEAAKSSAAPASAPAPAAASPST
jgi:putative FmdB family regulatory protein